MTLALMPADMSCHRGAASSHLEQPKRLKESKKE
jgi:hypothetical protein